MTYITNLAKGDPNDVQINISGKLEGDNNLTWDGTTLKSNSNIHIGDSLLLEDPVNGTKTVTLKAPDLSADDSYSFVLPVNKGTSNQILSTGATPGELIWVDQTAEGSSPTGPDFSIQFKNGSNFDGSSDLVWDNDISILEHTSISSVLDTSKGDTFSVTQTLPYECKVVGKVLFVTYATSGEFVSYDISDPTNISELNSLASVAGNGLDIRGNYAYIAGNGKDLTVVDIKTMTLVSVLDTSGSVSIKVKVQGDYAFVAYDVAGVVKIINISNPVSPFIVSDVSDTNSRLTKACGMYIMDNYLYVTGSGTTSGSTNVSIVDISDLEAASVVGFYDGATNSNAIQICDIVVENNIAYVTGFNSNSFAMIDVSNPISPSFLSKITSGTDTELTSPFAVIKHGDFVFVSSSIGGRVIKYNVSSGTPVKVVSSASSLGYIRSFDIIGNHLYAVSNSPGNVYSFHLGGINAFTLNTKSAEIKDLNVGHLSIEDGVELKDTLSVGRNLYVGNDFQVVSSQLSVKDTTKLNLKYTIASGLGGIQNMVSRGNYLYIANGGGMSIVDITDLSNPVIVNNALSFTSSAFDIKVIGNYAYVSAVSGTDFTVVDISDPTNISEVGSYNDNGGAFYYYLAPYGGFMYATRFGEKQVDILDISDPTNIQLKGVFNTVGDNSGITIRDNMMYIVSATESPNDIIQIYNLNDSLNPTFLGSYGDSGMQYCQNIEIRGKYAYVACREGDKFLILDISDPGSISKINTNLDLSTYGEGYSLSLKGDHVYLANYEEYGVHEGSFIKLDISDPTNVKLVDFFQDARYSLDNQFAANASVHAGEGFVAVGLRQQGGLELYKTNYSDMYELRTSTLKTDKLVASGESRFSRNVIFDSGITVSGNLSFGGKISGDIELADTTELNIKTIDSQNYFNTKGSSSEMFLLGDNTTLSSPRKIALHPNNTIAYVACNGNDRVYIFDISNPTGPVFITSRFRSSPNTLDGITDLFIQGNYLYCVGENSVYMQVFDITDPVSPVFPVSQSTITSGTGDGEIAITGVGSGLDCQGITVDGNFAYVACKNTEQLAIIDVTDPTVPTNVTNSQISLSGNGYHVVKSGNYAYVTCDVGTTAGVNVVDTTLTYNYQTDVVGASTGEIDLTTGGLTPAGLDTNVTLVDGVSRVLVKNQTTDDQENGVYIASTGAWSRDTEFGNAINVDGFAVKVTSGDTHGGQTFSVSSTSSVINSATIAFSLGVFNIASSPITEPRGIALSGNYVYVADKGDHFIVIDISTPLTADVIGSIQNNTESLQDATGVFVSGSIAYVASEASKSLTKIDISTPSSPSITETLIKDSFGNSASVAVPSSENYVYLISTSSETISTISNSSNVPPLILTNSFITSVETENIQLKGEKTSNTVGLLASTDLSTNYNLTFPTAPPVGSDYALTSNASGVMTWSDLSGTITVPGGTATGALQYRGAGGSFEADDNFLFTGGDTLQITNDNTGVITNLANPSNANDAANKSYVDGLALQGVSWKNPVIRASTVADGNFVLAGENQTKEIDGLALSNFSVGQRFLLKNQGSASENAIYEITSTSGTGGAEIVFGLPSDIAGAKASGTAVFVEEGTDNDNKGFIVTDVAGTDAFGSATSITWGQFTSTTATPSGGDGAVQIASGSDFSGSADLYYDSSGLRIGGATNNILLEHTGSAASIVNNTGSMTINAPLGVVEVEGIRFNGDVITQIGNMTIDGTSHSYTGNGATLNHTGSGNFILSSDTGSVVVEEVNMLAGAISGVTTLTADTSLVLLDSDQSHSVTIRANGTTTENQILTLPAAYGTGGSNYVLTDALGNGTLTWAEPSGGDISGTSNDTEILFNSSDVITGSSDFKFNTSNSTFSVLNSKDPVLLDTTSTTYPQVRHISIKDHFAFCTSWNTTLTGVSLNVFDISNPNDIGEAIEQLSGETGPSAYTRFVHSFIRGDYLYASSSTPENNVNIMDISDPYNVAKVVSFGQNSTLFTDSDIISPLGMDIKDNLLYIACSGTTKIVVYDISIKSNPVKIGAYTDANLSGVAQIKIYKNLLLCAVNGEFIILDITNPIPIYVNRHTNALSYYGIDVSPDGKYAFLTATTPSSDLVIYDITDPTSLATPISTTNLGVGAFKKIMYYSERYLLGIANTTFFRIDISNLGSPVIAGTITHGLAAAEGFDIKGSNVIMSGAALVKSLDIQGSEITTSVVGRLDSNFINTGSIHAMNNSSFGGSLFVEDGIVADKNIEANLIKTKNGLVLKDDTDGSISIISPSDVTDYTLILPPAISTGGAGSNYVLTDAEGDGVLSWAGVSGISVGGSNQGTIQFNDGSSGLSGDDTHFTYNLASKTLKLSDDDTGIITGLKDPSADNEAASKGYVDINRNYGFGITSQTQYSMGTQSTSWTSIAYGNSTYVAISNQNNSNKKVSTSTDGGSTWVTRVTANDDGRWNGIAWSESLGLFAAAGYDVGETPANQIMTSSNGVTWDLETTVYNGLYEGILWAGGTINKFVAMATGGIFDTSPNGTSWVTVDTEGNGFKRGTFSENLNLIVCIRNGTPSVVTSTNAVTWVERNTSLDGANNNDIIWVSSLNLFVIGGTHIATSSNGTSWTIRHTLSSGALNTLYFDPTSELIVGIKNSTAYFSSDGINWTEKSTTVNGYDSVFSSTDGHAVTCSFSDQAYVIETDNISSLITKKGPTSITLVPQSGADYTLELPIGTASAGQFLTDVAGDGVLSWADAGVDISGTSGDTELLFNSSDTITGSSDLTWDGTDLRLNNNKRVTLGTSASSQLWMFHDGNDCAIRNNDGLLIIENQTANSSDILFKLATNDGSTGFVFRDSGSQDVFEINSDGKLLFTDTGAGTNKITLHAGDGSTAVTAHTLILPPNIGANDTFLKVVNNSTGELGWEAAGVDISGTSNDTEILFNSSDAITGSPDFKFDTSNSELSIFNTLDPVSVHTNSSLANPRSIVKKDQYIFIGSRNNYLTVYDVSDPSSPVEVNQVGDGNSGTGDVDLSDQLYSVIKGNYLYSVSSEDSRLIVVDISDPENFTTSDIVYTTGVDVANFQSAKYLAIKDNYLYVAVSSKIQVLDISTPTAPFIHSTYGTDADIANIDRFQIYKNYIVCGSSAKIVILDISDPSTITKTASTTATGTTVIDDVIISKDGKYLFVSNRASTTNALVLSYSFQSIIDNDGGSSANLDSIEVSSIGNQPRQLYIYSERYLLFAAISKIGKLDISDPTNMQLIGSGVSLGTIIQNFTVDGQYLYGTKTNNGWNAIDLRSGNEMPSLKTGQLLSTDISSKEINTNKLFVNETITAEGSITSTGNVESGNTIINSNLTLKDDTNGTIHIKAPSDITETNDTYTLTLPVALGTGGSNYVLTDASGDGTLTWAEAAGGGTDISVTTNDTEILFNNTDVIEGDPEFTWDYTNKVLTVDGSYKQSLTGSPTSVGITSTTMDGPKGIATRGDYIYVCSHTNDSFKVLYTNPDSDASAAPVEIAEIIHATQLSEVTDIMIQSHYAYVVGRISGGDGYITIVDIREPTAPVIVDHFTNGNIDEGCNRVLVSGNYAFIPEAQISGATVYIVDISTPENIRGLNLFSGSGLVGINGLDVVGNYLYVGGLVGTNGAIRVCIFDNTSSIIVASVIGNVFSSASMKSISCLKVKGRYAYMGSSVAAAGAGSGIHVIDVSDPGAMSLVSTYTNTNTFGEIYNIVISGNYLYAAGQDGSNNGEIHRIDISDPSSLTLTGKLVLGTDPRGISISGKYLYVSDYADNTVARIDISGSRFDALSAGNIKVTDMQVDKDAHVFGSLDIGSTLSVGNDILVKGRITSATELVTNDALIIRDSVDESHSITIKAPALSANYTLNLPTGLNGSGPVVLTDTAGDGNLSWSSSVSVAGPNNAIQFTTDSSALSGSADLTWDGTSLQLGDSKNFTVGADDDLVISHSGTIGSITNTTGDLIIENDDTNDDIILRLGDAAAATSVSFQDSAAAEVASLDSNGTFTSTGLQFPNNSNAVSIGGTKHSGHLTIGSTLKTSDNIDIVTGTGSNSIIQMYAPADASKFWFRLAQNSVHLAAGNAGTINIGDTVSGTEYTTTGDIKLGDHQTTGNIQLGNTSQTGKININTGINVDKGSVTQVSNVNTGVTLNNPSGKITTVSLTIPSHEFEEFTVTNSYCSATNIVLCNIIDYNGDFTVTCSVKDIGAGSFKIVLSNPSGGSLSAAATIGFMII